jgi:ACS family allantoate permease-like MFS transporter
MIITGLITLVVGVCFWFFIPDNPMTAHFLTKEEKIIAIERLRSHSTGIENKTWKKDQFIEALTDWKPWAVRKSSWIDNKTANKWVVCNLCRSGQYTQFSNEPVCTNYS